MSNEHSAKAIIAAALIISNRFPPFSDFDAQGNPRSNSRWEFQDLHLMAETLGARDFNWRSSPMLMTLRRMTDAIHTALTDHLEPPTAPRARSGRGF